MNKPAFFILMVATIFYSCKENESRKAKKEEENYTSKEAESKVSVFPVTSFLKGQLNEIESSPLTLLKLAETNGKTDSVWSDRDSLRAFVAPFLQVQIDSATLSPYFDSRSFYDDEEDQYVLDYLANEQLPSDIHLNQITVYVNAADNSITTIYLVQKQKAFDGSVTRQLTWRTGNSCNINTIYQPEEGKPRITKEKMVWEF